MLFLLFRLDGHRYALNACEIVEILPLVNSTQTPHSPRGSVGFFNYRGRPIPLIDLNDLILGRKAVSRLSTRVILINYQDEQGSAQLIGLLAEQVTELMRGEEAAPAAAGATGNDAPYLRSLLVGEDGFVQLVDANALVAHRLRQPLCEAAS